MVHRLSDIVTTHIRL